MTSRKFPVSSLESLLRLHFHLLQSLIILVEEPKENFDSDLILDDIADENLDLDYIFVME